jgi:Mrp family chromosome partitioning ATPase
VPSTPASWLRVNGSSLVMGWAGEAEFDVRQDPRPTVTATLSADDELDGAWCCCLSVVPLVLPLFGIEPLHASAVRTASGTLAVLGRSGAGKSTVAAALVSAGGSLQADDACAIDADGRLWPGPPFLRLADRAQATAVPGKTVGEYDGKAVVRPSRWDPRPTDIAAVVALDPGVDRSLTVTPADSRGALRMLLANVRAPAALADLRRETQLRALSALAGRTRVARLSYAPGRHRPAQVADAVTAWFAGC